MKHKIQISFDGGYTYHDATGEVDVRVALENGDELSHLFTPGVLIIDLHRNDEIIGTDTGDASYQEQAARLEAIGP